MSVSFNGYQSTGLTFIAASGVTKGIPVSVSGNKTVSATASGNGFMGFALDVREGLANVQLSGYYKASYTGTAPTAGYATLGANGSGGVKVVTTGGTKCLVLNVDTVNSTAEFIF